MDIFRKLFPDEIESLKSQHCKASDWDMIEVVESFRTDYVWHTRFSGHIRLGKFEDEFEMPGGMRKHAGLYHVTLHNVSVGNDCCIENVKNYIANYNIGDNVFIENVDIILTDGMTSFGNGVEVAVMNETGGREVMIYDHLSAQTAYVMALYRHRPAMIAGLKKMILEWCRKVSSDTGTIASNVTIADTGYIKNVRIGENAKIEGASRLKNGSVNSTSHAPVHIGVNVVGDDFIICSGSTVEDGVTFSRCFIGQSCHLGHNYSAADSLFFRNCQGENCEACSIFAGPYTVTHHKSTLLIAGMFSFMNAGSGSNQSNHMYKLGPIHQGVLERGAKTASDSYILWPAKIGAFSLVLGRHVGHPDTSDMPFSYLIERSGETCIVPGANLRSVGTIRDAGKWPQRDRRTDIIRLDNVNCNLLSPYTIRKMMNGIRILRNIEKASGMSETYSWRGGKIKHSSLKKGISLYQLAIDKFLGNSLVTRIMSSEFTDLRSLRHSLKAVSSYGDGEWIDVGGMIAPKAAVIDILDEVENGNLSSVSVLERKFSALHHNYYEYEWKWAYDAVAEYYGIDLSEVCLPELRALIAKWKESVVRLDEMLYEDARKEFALDMMTSFGADGDEYQRQQDFIQVRGARFESDPFVISVKEHIKEKTELYDEVMLKLSGISSTVRKKRTQKQ